MQLVMMLRGGSPEPGIAIGSDILGLRDAGAVAH